MLEDSITPWMGPLAPWAKEEIVDKDDRARNWFAICCAISVFLHVVIMLLPLIQKTLGEPQPLAAGPISVSLEPVRPSRSEVKQPAPPPEPPRQSIIASRKPPTAAKPVYVAPPPEKPQPLRPPIPQTPPQPEDSMDARIAQRQAARQALEDDAARQNAEARGQEGPTVEQRILGNIDRAKKAASRQGGNGVFELTAVGVREGSFKFHGWHPGANDHHTETHSVDAGEGGDVRLSIVREMIKIIRADYKETDFNWESRRLGHEVKKSSRVADNAELESFLMSEMFDDPGQAPAPRRR